MEGQTFGRTEIKKDGLRRTGVERDKFSEGELSMFILATALPDQD